jgi:hypothetical protein
MHYSLIGNGFDVRHGHFTAPVKGLYLISGSIFTNAGYYAHIDIVKNGKAIAYLYTYSNTDISTQTVMVTHQNHSRCLSPLYQTPLVGLDQD